MYRQSKKKPRYFNKLDTISEDGEKELEDTMKKAQAQAEDEERDKRLASQLQEKNEFWSVLKREAAAMALAEEAREAKAKEAKEETREEAKAKEEARNNTSNEIYIEQINHKYDIPEEKYKEISKRKNDLNKLDIMHNSIKDKTNFINSFIKLAGYKRKSKHYKSKRYKKNRRIHKKTKKHVS